MTPEFRPWPKMPRLSKTSILITEKIDGTNACVVVDALGDVYAQSRKRIITPLDDNYGFAGWVATNADELRRLGEGYHFGEWWGLGIQRGYDQDRKRFSLFDANRWTYLDDEGIKASADVPGCCDVVPTLGRNNGEEIGRDVRFALATLRDFGSRASPGFMRPEGIVVWHERQRFKVLLENDDRHKGQVAA